MLFGKMNFLVRKPYGVHVLRGLKYMIPGLHPMEEQYVRTQTRIILDHEYKSREQQKENISKLVKIDISSKFLQDELIVKRICSLLDLAGIEKDEHRIRIFKSLSEETEEAHHYRSRSTHYQLLAAKVLYITLNKKEANSNLDIQHVKDYGQYVIDKFTDKRVLSANLHLYDDLLFKHSTKNYLAHIQSLKAACRVQQVTRSQKSWGDFLEGDKVNELRNIYILTEMFENDLQKIKTLLYLKKKVLEENALEVLIHLNVYDQLLPVDQKFDEEQKNEMTREGVLTTIYNYNRNGDVLNTISDFTLLAYHMKLLQDVGFDDLALKSFFNLSYPFIGRFLEQVDKAIIDTYGENFAETKEALSESLKNLNEHCSSRGFEISDEDKLLLIANGKSPSEKNVRDIHKKVFRITIVDKEKAFKHFNKTLENKKALSYLDLAMHCKNMAVPFFDQNISILRSRGLTMEQIMKNGEILANEPYKVSSILREIDDNPEEFEDFNLGEEWWKERNAVGMLNYVLEKNDKFSFENRIREKPLMTKLPSVKMYRQFHSASSASNTVYLQNPVTWIKNHFKLSQVIEKWDKNLDKNDFVRGSKCAVVAVLNEIQENNFTNLKGLFSKKELTRFRHEVETVWSDELRRNTGILEADVHHLVITDVRTQQIVQHKYLDIDVSVVAAVPRPSDTSPTHLYLVQATFHRDYTEGRLPDWIITSFKLHLKPFNYIIT